MAKPSNDQRRRLGRLTSFGLTEPWHVALFLPESYEDLTTTTASAHELTNEPSPIILTLAGAPSAYYDKVPRLVFPVKDSNGETFQATIFGDTKQWIEILKDLDSACFVATGRIYRDQQTIAIREMIEPEWVGRIRPKYAGVKQVITPQTARRAVLSLLHEAIAPASSFIFEQINAPVPSAELLRLVGAAGWTIEQLILQAHRPTSMRHALHAVKVLKRLAAIGCLQKLHSSTDDGPSEVRSVRHTTVSERIAQLPFQDLTDDQLLAITTISAAMDAPRPLRALCTGEVGTGKTCVAAVIAAATVDAVPGGGRVLIMCPNTLIASQFFEEISSYYPDISMQFVSSNTPTSTRLHASILVGTSALLSRDTGEQSFDLVVIDEQHRWSRKQREAKLPPGSHLLEMSATPIPRSLALIRYGKTLILPMRQTHKTKVLKTHMFEASARARMFKRLNANIANGQIVLVVHPKREVDAQSDDAVDLLGKPDRSTKTDTPKGAISDRHAISASFERWNAKYPGLVATLTSDDDMDTKNAVIQSLKDNKIQICLSTTVVEVGVTIPNLFLMVVVCPERLGLMQLHQLRGRLARHGGEGHFILYCPEQISDKQRRRLQFVASTTDGFAIAEFDMFERGVGDLSAGSDRQSGADETFLFGVKMDIRVVDEISHIVAAWRSPCSAAA